ncbi:MAG: cytochrome c biogenesis protein ResB [Bacteroidales bacterium]|nr:cytochrome c biogenesis protein ResB [Bacteroidales bacterium]
MKFSFDSVNQGDVNLIPKNNGLFLKAGFPIPVTNMTDQSVKMIPAGNEQIFYPMTVHNFNNQLAVLRKYLPSGKLAAIPTQTPVEKEQENEALRFEISDERGSKEIFLYGKKNQTKKSASTELNGKKISVSYGTKQLQLPFSIHLQDFILERYPGSNSPSWYESKVQVIDKENTFSQRIYMNNILKYKGYRFYQASYDSDEKGTVLSVNYDWAGTLISYLGYLFMALGMILSIFNPKSRFKHLLKESSNVHKAKKALILSIVFIVFALPGVKSQSIPIVDKKHAESFGELLIQDNGGRIKPINSYSSEILRKISRKTTFENLTSDQVLLSMIINPEIWQHQPLIKVSHEGINNVLGIQGKRVPFAAFFSKTTQEYILFPYANTANEKKPANRSKFDTEVIRTDERLNVFLYDLYGRIAENFSA